MATNSAIEWTDASWNCLSGCQAISPGCKLCYAATMTRRLEAMGQQDYSGLTTDKHFNGIVRCLPHKLSIPLKWRKPKRIFVNSMSDLFHEDVPNEFIDKVFAVMALCPQHNFQVLTKRAERMHDYILHWITEGKASGEWQNPLPNVWLGVSAEDQQRADERIPWLLKTPAAVRFVSAEPLLGPIDLTNISVPGDNTFYSLDSLRRLWRGRITRDVIPGAFDGGLGWVICGGESGGGARPCDRLWIDSIVRQCNAAGVPVFVKQLGSNAVEPDGMTIGMRERMRLNDRKGGDIDEFPESLRVRQFPTDRLSAPE